MEYTACWLKEDAVRVIGIADVHVGSPQSRLRELKTFIEQNKDSAFFVFLGDVIDNAIVDSVSDIYEQTMNPEHALFEFYQLLDLVPGRVLGIVSGNHEERTKRRVGVDLLKVVAQQKSIAYSEDILVIDLSVGNSASRGSKRRIQYTIAVGHGYSSARGIGAKITGNGRIIDVITNADIYLTAHTHQPSIVKAARFEADTRNKKLFLREFYLVTVPSWLGYEHYAAQKFMHPSALGYIEIVLSGVKKDITVSVK